MALVGLAACGGPTASLTNPCQDAPPVCVRSLPACDTPAAVAPECAGAGWQCPVGSERWDDNAYCEVLGELSVSVVGPAFKDGASCRLSIGHDGWLATESVASEFACGSDPQRVLFDRRAIDDEVQVDLTDAVVIEGQTYGFYRRFIPDSTQPLGVRPDGSGVAPLSDGVFVLPADTMWPDSNYRSVFLFEGSLYISRAQPPAMDFQYPTQLERVAPNELLNTLAYELVAQDVLRVGPQHDIHHYPQHNKFVLSTAVGFGDQLEFYEANRPEGPWALNQRFPCDRPLDDPRSFCDSVRQVPHKMLFSPATVPVTYRIGSLGPDREMRRRVRPSDYRARETWYALEPPELSRPLSPN